MLLLAAALVLSQRGGRWRTVGLVVICLLCVLFVVGSLGELFAEPTVDVPRWVLVASGLGGTVVYGSLLVLGVRELRGRRLA
jgi:hypothetical protein